MKTCIYKKKILVTSQDKSWKQEDPKVLKGKSSLQNRWISGTESRAQINTQEWQKCTLYLFFITRSGGTKLAIMLITCILYRDAGPGC